MRRTLGPAKTCENEIRRRTNYKISKELGGESIVTHIKAAII